MSYKLTDSKIIMPLEVRYIHKFNEEFLSTRCKYARKYIQGLLYTQRVSNPKNFLNKIEDKHQIIFQKIKLT